MYVMYVAIHHPHAHHILNTCIHIMQVGKDCQHRLHVVLMQLTANCSMSSQGLRQQQDANVGKVVHTSDFYDIKLKL